MAENTQIADPSFDRWTTMADLQIKFLDSVGNYRLKVAQAGLADAQAAYQLALTEEALARVRAKEAVIRQFELDLDRLNRARYQAVQQKNRIEEMAKNAVMIRSAEHLSLDLLSIMWQGYKFFENLAPISVLDYLMDEKILAEARPGKNFVFLRDHTKSCDDVPIDYENVTQLLDWIEEKRYMPRKGWPAYRQIFDAFAQVASTAEGEITQLQTNLDAMQKNTYNVWKPIRILGVDVNVDGKPETTTDSDGVAGVEPPVASVLEPIGQKPKRLSKEDARI